MITNKKKVIILYSKLSDYMLNVFKNYANNYDVEFHILKKSVDDKEAPFQLELNLKNCFFYNEENFDKLSLLELCNQIDPNLIICSGWANKKYNFVVDHYYKLISCILTMDNQWNGTVKQYLGVLYSRLFLVSKFQKIWVPGEPQKEYARKLGFKNNSIFTGLYVANKNTFLNSEKGSRIMKKFVFVGRYVSIKGIQDLCEAFIELSNISNFDWELHCIGTGPLEDSLPIHPKIKHLGFMQPKELKRYIAEKGVFVLPSHFEPWGLVVQEFALAGFPLIVSDKVGAATQFVSDENGFIFKAKNKNSLKKTLLACIYLDQNKLNDMGKKSISKAVKINEENWAASINSFLK